MAPNNQAPTTAAAEARPLLPKAGLTLRDSRRGPSRLFGEIVVELGFADPDTVTAAVSAARENGRPTGQELVERGVLNEDQLARVLAKRFGVDYVDLSVYEVDVGAINVMSMDDARRYQAVPIDFMGDGLLVAMADPSNILAVDDISMITGLKVRPAAASVGDIRALLSRLGRIDGSVVASERVDDEPAEVEFHSLETSDSPNIKLVHSILAEAIDREASDIHFDPEEDEMRVQFRVDGVLHPAGTIRRSLIPGVVSRLKVMANLDISERRVPQDGRLALKIDDRRVDLRVVTLPVIGGEAVVLRILDSGSVVRKLDSLGMLLSGRERFSAAIAKRQGAVLITGPTGSGKSTTLYAALAEINTGDRSILTLEDPVESRMPGIKQMQIAPKVGVTFANGLRSMLRADPDVIMVGEIRDRDTAHIAIEAALTGHLVLASLHTRDAPSAVTRLADMGIPPFLLAGAIDCVVAQRLVRVLCTQCRRPADLPDSVLAEHGLEGATVFEPVGCARCGGSGYRGRTGVYEVMTVTEELRALVLDHRGVDEIAALAVAQGMRRMRDDGLEKVRSGETSIIEVGRAIGAS